MRRATSIAAACILASGVAHLTEAQVVSPTRGEMLYTAAAPEIDGVYDAAWEASNVFVYPDSVGHRWGAFVNNPEHTTGPEDFSGHFRTLWDEQYVYVWVQMTDQELFSDGAQECWRSDAIELLLDGGNEKLSSYDANDAYLAMRLGGEAQPDWDPNICTLSVLDREKAIANVVYASAPTDTGWVMEVRVPWENVDVIPANGKEVGMEIYASDADGRITSGTVQRDISRAWAWSESGNGWQNPAAFGTMTLAGGPGGAVANATFTADPTSRVIVGDEISFDASASTAPGAIIRYAWDFGDGMTGEGATITHSYQMAGRYLVTLSVEDEGGALGTSERAITAWDGIGLPESPLEIPMAASVPVIDGDREEVWGNAQHVSIATRTNGIAPETDADLSAEAWLLWDEENLYVFFDVNDDVLFNDSGDNWQDDTPEVYLDGGYERADAYDENDAQFELSWNGDVITGTNQGTTGAAHSFVTKDGDVGYTLEVNLPWTNVGLTAPNVGTPIGLELMINDDDVGGLDRQTKIGWFAPEGVDNAFDTPGAFGSAVLVAELVATERSEELPESFVIESIYPNPFNPTATAVLQVGSPGAYELSVRDVLGRLIHREEVRATAAGRMDVAVDLPGRASGVYLFSVRQMETGMVVNSTAMLLK